MSKDIPMRGCANPEMADFTQAVLGNFFDKEYFEDEYSGRITDYERLKEIESEFYDNLAMVVEGLDLSVSDVEPIENFHEAGVLHDVHANASYFSSALEDLEDKHLVEVSEGDGVSYGPLAFPYLKLRADLEDALRDEEWYPSGQDETVEEPQAVDGGSVQVEEAEEELDDGEKDLQDIFDEVSGGEHVETIEQKDDGGLDSRDHTDRSKEEEEDIDMDDDAGYEGFT